MMRIVTKTGFALALIGLIAGCSGGSQGSDGGASKRDSGAGALLRQAAGQIVAQRRAARAPKAAPRSADQIAASALNANPNPLILTTLESRGATQAMAMVGENRGTRTYMTPNEQALMMRGGLLVGTRGLGHDIASVEIGTESLIRARRNGQASRVMRYYSGDGVERPLPMNCTITTGAAKSFDFAGRSWSTRQVVESCQGAGAQIQNNYLVSAGGQIPLSRQWIGPDLGYVTIQTIRP